MLARTSVDRPQDHGFPSSKSLVTLKIVDSASSKSFGSVSLRCSAPMSRVRQLLSAEDSTAFVFLDGEGFDVQTSEEKGFKVGMLAPKKLSLSIPLLPSLEARPEDDGEEVNNDESTPKKRKVRLGKDFTAEDIQLAVAFMDKNGDGEISFKELADAFRKSRRTKADAKLQAKGRKMLSRIKDLIRAAEITVHQWFELMDGSGAAESNGCVSTMELRKGLAALCAAAKKKRFSEVRH